MGRMDRAVMADSVAKWVSSLELPAITIVSLFLLNESFSCSETPRDTMERAMTADDMVMRSFLENLETSRAANRVPDNRMKLVRMAAK
jgi:hypothetical protein